MTLASTWIDTIPPTPETSIVAWAEQHVRLPGSAKTARFDCSLTPWLREPLEHLADGVTRIIDFVKPIQTGGSVLGEVALCYWLSTQNGGDVQYNWEDDEKAYERWEKRIVRILMANKEVMKRWPYQRHQAKKGLVMFAHCNLTVQGVHSESNLDSDSIRFQINEEIHNWEPGRLAMAFGRTTAFWNSCILNISNAGTKGDQLHQSYEAGTQQHLLMRCPGCNGWHTMQTKFDKKKEHLGGLRYDSEGCKLVNGRYDYQRLEKTVRYQMPCGHVVPDEIQARRRLALSCKWSEPMNEGAHLSHRSYNYDAVVVDSIPWLSLIMEKNQAIFAMKRGDAKPWHDYITRRECLFHDPQDRPFTKEVTLTANIVKNRDGLAGRYARFFAMDRQQGSLAQGETPHWWLVIRDAMPNGDSRLVYEGKIETDADVISTLDEHGCVRRCGVADSGDDTTHVYNFCLRHGINAIKGGKTDFYSHVKEGKRIFSMEEPLHRIINQPPRFDYVNGQPNQDEPMFWLYSKKGIADRLGWITGKASEIKHEVPSDVSEDYLKHRNAEELVSDRASDGSFHNVWKQVAARNDLLICERYIAMLMEMAGLIGMKETEPTKE